MHAVGEQAAVVPPAADAQHSLVVAAALRGAGAWRPEGRHTSAEAAQAAVVAALPLGGTVGEAAAMEAELERGGMGAAAWEGPRAWPTAAVARRRTAAALATGEVGGVPLMGAAGSAVMGPPVRTSGAWRGVLQAAARASGAAPSPAGRASAAFRTAWRGLVVEGRRHLPWQRALQTGRLRRGCAGGWSSWLRGGSSVPSGAPPGCRGAHWCPS